MIRVGTTGPQTLLHADPRLDNMFFGTDEVALIDWQLILRGRGVADLCYLIGSSMEIPDQQRHWERLVRRWYDAVVAGGITDYSWEQALHDYRESLLSLLSGPMSLVGTFNAGNERGAAMVGGVHDPVLRARPGHRRRLGAARLTVAGAAQAGT